MGQVPSVSAARSACFPATQTYVGDGVQGGVGTDAEIGPRHIVGHGGGNHNHRDTELLMFPPGGGEFQQSQVGLWDKHAQLGGGEAAEGHQQSCWKVKVETC